MTIDITINSHPSTPWPVVWAPVLSAFGVFVVGCIAASIAFQQWRTARTKLQLDLYDRRLAIFEAGVEHIGSAIGAVLIGTGLDLASRRELSRTDEVAFYRKISGAQFLYGPSIDHLLELIRLHAREARKFLADDDCLDDEHWHERLALQTALFELKERFEKRCTPFLDLDGQDRRVHSAKTAVRSAFRTFVARYRRPGTP